MTQVEHHYVCYICCAQSETCHVMCFCLSQCVCLLPMLRIGGDFWEQEGEHGRDQPHLRGESARHNLLCLWHPAPRYRYAHIHNFITGIMDWTWHCVLITRLVFTVNCDEYESMQHFFNDRNFYEGNENCFLWLLDLKAVLSLGFLLTQNDGIRKSYCLSPGSNNGCLKQIFKFQSDDGKSFFFCFFCFFFYRSDMEPKLMLITLLRNFCSYRLLFFF